MEIKAVKFRKEGFYSQPFAFGGEEGPDKFDPKVRYRGSLQNYLIDTGDEVILVDTGLPAGTPEESPDETSQKTYQSISQDEAKKIMETDTNYIIVDVRRPDEFETGHIPGAICILNEEIDTEKPAQLQDLEQTILVYCRSGRRSKEASQKLADMGYTNIYEFGGIIDWTGEIVTD